MLNQYIDNLQNCIQWAQYQDDIDILCLARDRMDQLLAFVDTLPVADQYRVHHHIDQVLPMEWPLWMEACRCEDPATQANQPVMLH